MKEYELDGCLYRVRDDGVVETQSAYSNVWMLSRQHQREENLKFAGAKEVKKQKT